jgi:hypothetical protein
MNNDLAINPKDASKKSYCTASRAWRLFWDVCSPQSQFFCLKITFMQEVKSRLRTSVTKEGTASGKHKEYSSPCIAAHTLLLRAPPSVRRT